VSTARLKSGAAKSWEKTDPGRAEILALPAFICYLLFAICNLCYA